MRVSMPHVRGTVHGVGAMGTIILGGVITQTVKAKFAIVERVSDLTTTILIDMAQLPIAEEVASIIIPVGILMFVWVFMYELRKL